MTRLGSPPRGSIYHRGFFESRPHSVKLHARHESPKAEWKLMKRYSKSSNRRKPKPRRPSASCDKPARESDALLAIYASGRSLWSDEHADEYVRRLREDGEQAMAIRCLNKNALSRDEDWFGNNAAVRCPVCGRVFVVSGFIKKGQRQCPNCQKSTAHITKEQATIEWSDAVDKVNLLTRAELGTRLDEFVALVKEGGAVARRSIENRLPKAVRWRLSSVMERWLQLRR
jgi:phage FluMu protein Com